MNDNIKEPESITEKEQKSVENTDSKSEESGVSGISFLIGLFVGLGFMAYAAISSQSDLLEIALNADNTPSISLFMETLLIMFKGVGAGLCGYGSCLVVNSYTGGTHDNKTIGTTMFLSGLVMMALKTLISVGAMPIQ